VISLSGASVAADRANAALLRKAVNLKFFATSGCLETVA
jgi:hypothetical protein